MSKEIRPLTAYKKANPEIYKFYLSCIEKPTSKKGIENDFYFWYAILQLKKVEDKSNFFLTPNGDFTNKGTVSEIGRLLLYGWYYNIENWAQNVAMYIYKAYNKKIKSEDIFNDLEFKKAINHIRDNIAYYYNKEQELKLYILETFFNKKLQKILPEKPKSLKEHDNSVQFLLKIRENQKKKGIDYWINKTDDLEQYSYYLIDILEKYNLEFLSFEDYNKIEQLETEKYYKNIDNLRVEYKDSYINNINQIDLT
jgi:hypothetical protein